MGHVLSLYFKIAAAAALGEDCSSVCVPDALSEPDGTFQSS